MKKRRRFKDWITDLVWPSPEVDLPPLEPLPPVSETNEAERETIFAEVRRKSESLETMECEDAEAPPVPNGVGHEE